MVYRATADIRVRAAARSGPVAFDVAEGDTVDLDSLSRAERRALQPALDAGHLVVVTDEPETYPEAGPDPEED